MSDLRIGNVKPLKIYRGTSEVSKVYKGTELVWSSGPTWSSVIQSFVDDITADPGSYYTEDLPYDVYDSASDPSGFVLFVRDLTTEGFLEWYYSSQYPSLLNDLTGWSFFDEITSETYWHIESYDKHTYYLAVFSGDYDKKYGDPIVYIYEWQGV